MKQFKVLYSGEKNKNWSSIREQAGIGASESPAILGLSPFASALSVYAQRVGTITVEANEAMEWGNRLERTILDAYVERTGRNVKHSDRLCQSVRWPFLVCSPDGIEYDDDFKIIALAQIKLTSKQWDGEVPAHVVAQCQHEMAVMGTDRNTAVALLAGTKMVWQDIERNDAYINDELAPTVEQFWNDLQNGTPPRDVDDSDATTKALKLIYPEAMEGSSCKLDSSFYHMKLAREELIGERNDIVQQIRGIDNQVRSAMGNNELGVLSDGSAFTLKTTHAKEKIVAASTYRTLRIRKAPKGALK